MVYQQKIPFPSFASAHIGKLAMNWSSKEHLEGTSAWYFDALISSRWEGDQLSTPVVCLLCCRRCWDWGWFWKEKIEDEGGGRGCVSGLNICLPNPTMMDRQDWQSWENGMDACYIYDMFGCCTTRSLCSLWPLDPYIYRMDSGAQILVAFSGIKSVVITDRHCQTGPFIC